MLNNHSYLKLILLILFFVSNQLLGDEKIVFLFYNDFHAQNLSFREDVKVKISPLVGGAATLGAYISRYREKYGPNVCLVNAGDDFQGSPVCSMTEGQSQIEILNLIRPDVMTLGNHEFDYGRDGINRLLEQAQFPIICANCLDKKMNRPLTPPYLIKKFGNLRIGFIGLVIPRMHQLTLSKNVEGYVFLDPKAILIEYTEILKAQTDIIVLVSHLGHRSDISLAKKSTGFQVIFGGHTHKSFFKPLIYNDVLICQAGAKGRYLGILELWVSREQRKITRYKMRLITTFIDEITPDSTILALVNTLEKPVEEKLSRVIGELKSPWINTNLRTGSNIAIWMADAIREHARTDIAFINSSGIRKELPAGKITVRDIWEIEPFSNTITTFTVTGKELKHILKTNHFGSGKFLVPSGMRYHWVFDEKKGNRIHDIQIGGRPIDMQCEYTVSSNNFLTGEMKFKKTFDISYENRKILNTGVLIRDVMIAKIEHVKTIESKIDFRITKIRKKALLKLHSR